MDSPNAMFNDTRSIQHIRDLTWAINSPSLVIDQPSTSDIDPNQVDPRHLASFLAESGSPRVGKYFERLVLYWLKFVRGVEVVAESVQIREGNRTIGEIDLLFRDEQGRLTHWELAVKFYLHFSGVSPIDSHFIGPNAADTFEQKMNKLFEHQLSRSEKHFPDVEIRQAFVKGRIFYHSSEAKPQELPSRLSPNHLQGTWIRASQLDRIPQDDSVSYRILRKPLWLSENTTLPNPFNESALLSPQQLIANLADHFIRSNRPVLVSQMVTREANQAETGRIFVVPVNWPDLI